MKRTFLFFFAVMAALFCIGCAMSQPLSPSAQKEAEAVYHKLTAAQAKEAMDQGGDFILLDVRTPEEFAQAHIPGAVLIPDFEIADRAEEDLPDKQKTLYIYCRSGRRSANAALQLVEMGYTNVYDFGGIIDWPYDTVTGEQ